MAEARNLDALRRNDYALDAATADAPCMLKGGRPSAEPRDREGDRDRNGEPDGWVRGLEDRCEGDQQIGSAIISATI
jgi:hypothetical protein